MRNIFIAASMTAAITCAATAQSNEVKPRVMLEAKHDNALQIEQFDFSAILFPNTALSSNAIQYGDIEDEVRKAFITTNKFDLPNLALSWLPNTPFQSLKYSDLTKEIAQKFEPSQTQNILPCSENFLQILDSGESCTNKKVAQETLQLRKSVQAFAKALELSGSGLPTRAQEDLIINDIQKHGLDLGLITPAMQLARVYAADSDYFDDRGRNIYELSNVALGYLYTPNYRLSNPLTKHSFVDPETCEVIETETSSTISLLEYNHPTLSNEVANYAITDEYNNEVVFFPDTGSLNNWGINFESYTSLGTELGNYQLRGSTSPYDITQIVMPELYGLSLVDRHSALLIEDISGGLVWQKNDYDAIQSLFDGPTPFEYYASGANGLNACRINCVTQSEILIEMTLHGRDIAISGAKTAAAIYTGQPKKAVYEGAQYLHSIGSATVYAKTIDNACHLTCSQIETAKEDIRWHSHDAKAALEAERSGILQRLKELKAENNQLKDNLKDVDIKLTKKNDSFDEVHEKEHDTEQGGKTTPKKRRELDEKKVKADEERVKAQEERTKITDRQKKVKEETEKLKKEAEENEQKIIENERKIKEAQEELKEAEKKLLVPKQQQIDCKHPGFTMPQDTLCVYDPKTGNWKLVNDQAALDKRAYLHVCARITVSPGSTCTVIGGRPVIVSLPKRILDYSNAPKINHCNSMYVTEGSTCKMVGGRAVITNLFDSIISPKSPELSTSFCHYATVEEGYECINGPNGQPIIKPAGQQASAAMLNLIQNSRSVLGRNNDKCETSRLPTLSLNPLEEEAKEIWNLYQEGVSQIETFNPFEDKAMQVMKEYKEQNTLFNKPFLNYQ